MPILIALALAALVWLGLETYQWVVANLWVLLIPAAWLALGWLGARFYPGYTRNPRTHVPSLPEPDGADININVHHYHHHEHAVAHHHTVEHRHTWALGAEGYRATPSLGRGAPELTRPVVVEGTIVQNRRKELR